MKWTFALAFLVVACSKSSSDDSSPVSLRPAPGGSLSGITVTSGAFAEGAPIPAKFTCEGENVSPALSWTDPPAATKTLALVVDDPDAKGFVHWVAYGMDASTRTLAEGAKPAHEGTNDFGKLGYGGPCPPSGRHRYRFQVYALDVALGDLGQPKGGDLAHAMDQHVLAAGTLTATYQKGG